MKILLAEDTETSSFIMQTILKRTGFDVTAVVNGVKAVEAYQQDLFDLILMDIQMPEMDGYTATRTIRNYEHQNGLAPVPIIALTAHANEEDIVSAMEAGCTEHLSKPVKKDYLFSVMEKILGPIPDNRVQGDGSSKK